MSSPAADFRTVRVRLYAAARERGGSDIVEVPVSADATIDDLRVALVEAVPGLRELAPHLLFAVGTEYATAVTPVPVEGDVVAFPPVSGG